MVLLTAACGFGEPAPPRDDGLLMTPVAATRLPLQPSVPVLSGDPQPALADPIEAGLTPDEVEFLSRKCAGEAEITNTADECFRKIAGILARDSPCDGSCLRAARAQGPGVTHSGPDGSPTVVFPNSFVLIQVIDDRCRAVPNRVCLQLPVTPVVLQATKGATTSDGTTPEPTSSGGTPGGTTPEPTSDGGTPGGTTPEPTSDGGTPGGTPEPTSGEDETTAEPDSADGRTPVERGQPEGGVGSGAEREAPPS
jgi:hypothetical protein